MAITYTDTKAGTTEVKYTGCVLHKRWTSYQIMSDDWAQAEQATVWNAETGRIEHVMGTIEGYGYDPVKIQIVVDATAEMIAKIREYTFQQNLKVAVGTLAERAQEISKGDTVKVVSGRNAKGTVGKVVVSIQRLYGMGYRSSMRTKFAVATSDVMVPVIAANGKTYMNHADVVWVWAHNCEKQNIPAVDMAEAEEMAEGLTKRKMVELGLETYKKAA